MFRKKLVTLIMIFFVILLNYSPTTSYACSCMAPISVQEELTKNSAVFSGKVIDILDVNKNNKIQSSADPIAFLFEVDEAWKGIDQTQVIVYTERDSASCGYPFTINDEYMVYANEIEGQLKTNICSRTANLSSAFADIEELGFGEKPTEHVNLEFEAKSIEGEVSTNNFFIDNVSYVISIIVIALIAGIYLLRRNKK